MSGKWTVGIVRRRLSALLTGAIVMPLASGLGLAGGVADLVLAPVSAQAYAGKPNVVSVNADLSPGPSTGYPYQTGGRVEALAVQPINGTQPRLVLAASQGGGLWQATVDTTGKVFSHWSHVDSLPAKHLEDVKFIPGEPNVAIASDNSFGPAALEGIWRGVYNAGAWTWTQTQSSSVCTPTEKISIVPGPIGNARVYVADFCGIFVSGDSGQNFTLTRPNTAGPIFGGLKAENINPGDPVLGTPPVDQVDLCGNIGFMRWTSGAQANGFGPGSWSNPVTAVSSSAIVGGTGSTRTLSNQSCSLDESLDTTNIFIATQSFDPTPPANKGNNGGELFESDNSGVTWTDLKPTGDTNGQPAWVKIEPPVNNLDTGAFDVYFGTSTQALVQLCNVRSTPTRCGVGNNNDGAPWVQFDRPALQSGQSYTNHEDASGLFFDDPHDTTYNGCPWVETSDGGIFRDGVTYSSTINCSETPVTNWLQQNLGLRALESYAISGTIVPATSTTTAHTDLYAGLQDDGLLMSQNSGSQWESADTADVNGVWSDLTQSGSSKVLYHWCCGGVMKLAPDAFTSTPTPLKSPPGTDTEASQVGETFLGTQFGAGEYAVITANGPAPGAGATFDNRQWTMFVTTNQGGTWTQVGPSPLAIVGPPLEVRAAATSTGTDFYVISAQALGNLTTPQGNQLFKISGALNSTATLVNITKGLSNPNLFGVNPFDPNRLYVYTGTGSTGGKIFHTTTGTANAPTWTEDTTLEALIKSPSVLGGPFGVFGEPTVIAYDVCSTGIAACKSGKDSDILVGTQDTGIYFSSDDGAHWHFMRGSDALPTTTGAFFDPSNQNIFVSTFGRGVWAVNPPPQSTLTIGTPQVAGPPPLVNGSTKFTVSATGRRPVASVSFRATIAGGTPGSFATTKGTSAAFQIQGPVLCINRVCNPTPAVDGLYKVEFYATDNAGNEETPQSQMVQVINTAPVVTMQINGAQVTSTTPTGIVSTTKLSLSAQDVSPDTIKTLSVREYPKGATTLPGYTTLPIGVGFVGVTMAIPTPTGTNNTIFDIDFFATDSLGVKTSNILQVQYLHAISVATAICSGSFDMQPGTQFETATCGPASSGDLAWNPAQIMTPGGLSGVQMVLVGSVSFSGVTESQLESLTYTTQMSVQPAMNQVYGVYGHDGHYAKLLVNTVGTNLTFTFLTYPDVAPPPAPPPLCSGTGSMTPGTSSAFFDLECGKGTNNPGINVNPFDVAGIGGIGLNGTLNPAALNTVYDWTLLASLGQVSFDGVTEAQLKTAQPYSRGAFVHPGDVFGVYTRDGYYAKMRIDSVSTTDDTEGFTYLTYADQSFPPPTHTWCFGSGTVSAASSIDFDQQCVPASQGDVQWDGSNLSPGTLTSPDAQTPPENTYSMADRMAVVGNVNFDSLTLAQMEQLQYGFSSASGLTPGTVVAIETRGGFFTKLRVDSVGSTLGVTYLAYRDTLCEAMGTSGSAPGSAYLSPGNPQWDAEARCGNSLIPGDTGDLSWDPTTNLLTPLAGAEIVPMSLEDQFTLISLDDLKGMTYVPGSLNVSQVAGQVLALRTRHGHYAKVLVEPNSCCGQPELAISEFTYQ